MSFKYLKTTLNYIETRVILLKNFLFENFKINKFLR